MHTLLVLFNVHKWPTEYTQGFYYSYSIRKLELRKLADSSQITKLRDKKKAWTQNLDFLSYPPTFEHLRLPYHHSKQLDVLFTVLKKQM